ncbi:MAG: TraR/DksA C4-type zinc finger protein [Candidatus Kapabacteria bacterium]|nr:TraR/DksA C4-type zinc finger protein [Candidatus Kapabacteria bacterium]
MKKSSTRPAAKKAITQRTETTPLEQPVQQVEKPARRRKKQEISSPAPQTTPVQETSSAPISEPTQQPSQPAPPPKPAVRYSDEELEEFRQIIEAERQKTLDEIRMLRERLEDLTNYETSEETGIYSMHMAEQGSEAYEREKTYAQIQRMTDYLRKLDEALKRIEDKTYGICRMCGILIAKERLRAVPITTLSASWKLRGKCPEDGIDRVGPDIGGE